MGPKEVQFVETFCGMVGGDAGIFRKFKISAGGVSLSCVFCFDFSVICVSAICTVCPYWKKLAEHISNVLPILSFDF